MKTGRADPLLGTLPPQDDDGPVRKVCASAGSYFIGQDVGMTSAMRS
jgi:hypothetical protein